MDSNVRFETMKLLQESIGVNFHDVRLRRDFIAVTPKAQATEGK